jgi:ABC-type branched-subunit amino acid transport system ATPase component/predicted MFS family arabinose efflux permease
VSRVSQRLAEMRPSSITGGAPTYPLLVLFGLNAVEELDRSAVGILTPEIRDHFGLSIAGITSLFTLVFLVAILLAVPIAYYADRYNRVRIAIVGASMWMGFALLTGLSPTVVVLGIALAGSGIGSAVNTPTHLPLLADYYGVETRVRVYGFYRVASSLGQFVGPLSAGVLAYFLTWRAPFIVFVVPTAIFIFFALRLKDPARGAQERRALGADDEVVQIEEHPPGLFEGFRLLWQVRTLRRYWATLPFFAPSIIGLVFLFAIFYAEEFGLNEVQRGIIAAVTEPFQVVALIIGIPLAFRLASRGPAFLLRLSAGLAMVVGGLVLVLVLTPNLAFAIAANILMSALSALIAPTLLAMLSLLIPPRARAMGFSLWVVFALPGLIVLPIIGGVADRIGIRPAMLILIPVYFTGALILLTAGKFVAGDIQRTQTAAVAQAGVIHGRRQGKVKLLTVRDLDVAYDRVQVLFGVDFDVDEGEIVALLGTNGAGKSTLLRAISGLTPASGGTILFDGRDTTYAAPNSLVAMGITQVPGGRGVFPSLTVEENLKIAGWLYRRDPKHVEEATRRVLEYFPVLEERWGELAGSLSGGEQQMLTLGQAFIAKPKLLMIDELSLGLAPIIVEKLLEIVEAIRAQGTTIILVEQSVNVALTVAQTAYFMEKGEIRFHGRTTDLLRRPDILRSVFLKGGASLRASGSKRQGRRTAPSRSGSRGEPGPVLEVKGLHKSFGGVTAVEDVSFDVGSNHILGIIGPNGAGKTTVFDLLSGFLLPDEGEVNLRGTDLSRLGADVRSRMGLGRSFQDARLFGGLTVAETIALALDRKLDIKDPIAEALNLPAVARSKAQVAKTVDEIIELLGLGDFRDKFISELSTGSRRIVDIGCSLAHEPSALLLDEPSSGIAQKEVEALGPMLLRIPQALGTALLVIEHDIPLITSISDELIAMDLGKVIARGKPLVVVKDRKVVTSYLGTSDTVIQRSGERSSKSRRPGTASAASGNKTQKPKRRTRRPAPSAKR